MNDLPELPDDSESPDGPEFVEGPELIEHDGEFVSVEEFFASSSAEDQPRHPPRCSRHHAP